MSKQKPGDDQHSKLSHEKLAETKLTLERLRSHQTPLVPKTFNAPFLGGPHPFMSSRSREESDRAQADQLIAPPAPKRSPPVMDLAEVIGQQQVDSIAASGQIVFHTVGDTGFGGREDLQEVAEIMAMDFHRPNPADHPAFFLHLGDVVYNHQYHDPESKKGMYDPQFYVPYRDYPGKIVAIPGNHDCNPQEDPHSIQAFEDNFCVDPPASQQALDRVLGVPKRTPMFQPGVYYCLDAPFVNIIALFSNGGETEGEIRGGVVGEEQWNFLVAQLAAIKKEATPDTRKALLVAVHHPPLAAAVIPAAATC